MDPIATIKKIMSSFEFSDYGFAPLKTPETIGAYKSWLNNNFNGEMNFLKDHLPLKESPKSLLEHSQCAIVVTKNYFPTNTPHPTQPKSLRIAEYAKNEDYHFWFQQELQSLIAKLQEHFNEHTFLAMTDSKPVLERDLAHQAGLGWFGKNTCLIHQKKGSLFFIGEIYTSLALSTKVDIHPDRCGQCTRCIDACPTQALIEPYVLDANKCISYLTIEKKGDIEASLMNQMNDWFFGCDICQSVCPWNEKAFSTTIKKEQVAKKQVTPELVSELKWILTTSGKKLLKDLSGSPLTRARASGLKRNAMIVIGNLKIKELRQDVEAYLSIENHARTAKWCLQKLS